MPGESGDPALICDPDRVAAIADDVRRAGHFVFDLEFVSEGRYVPELSLFQLGWMSEGQLELAVIDCVAVSAEPVAALVADPEISCVAHSARQDLGLLASRFGIVARHFMDSQIAAAFAGYGDQIGFGKLVQQILGVALDKSSQFTAWLDRPLSDKQLTYAINDVRYLAPVWHRLEQQLQASGRLGWVAEESRVLADKSQPTDPAHAYRDVSGWHGLGPRALGALRELAAWRLERALSNNRPPERIVASRELLRAAERSPRTESELQRVRDLPARVCRRHGSDMLACIVRGTAHPEISPAPPRPTLRDTEKLWSQLLLGIVRAKAASCGIAHRFLATSAELDQLVAWQLHCPGDEAPKLPLLSGWRRQVIGQDLLSLLDGQRTLVIRGFPTDAKIDFLPRAHPQGNGDRS